MAEGPLQSSYENQQAEPVFGRGDGKIEPSQGELPTTTPT